MSANAAKKPPVPNVLTELETNILNKAFYDLVHDFQGGASRIASSLGKSASTLCHEVNPHSENHKLGVFDLIKLMRVTDSSIALQNICMVLGFTLVPVRKFEGCSDIEVLTMYASWHKELGDVSKAVSEAFLDEKITHREYAKILREGIESNAAFHGFLSRLESIMEVH